MKKEIKIGLTVIVAFAILIWGFNFLKGRDILKVGDFYYGSYARIDGLTNASPLYYKGFKVGYVRDIDFHPTIPNRFLVTFELKKNVPLPIDSKAQIYSLDLMGTKGVQLIPGKSDELLAYGDTLQTSVMGDLKDQVSMEVLPLKDKAERLIVQLDSVFTNLGDIVDEENRTNIKETMKSFRKSMKSFQTISSRLSEELSEGGEMSNVIKRTDSVMMMLTAQGPYIDTVFQSMAGFSQQLENAQIDESLQELKKTLGNTSELLATINEGDGSLGLLLTDKELYYSLTEVSASLNRLLIDVRHNPKRYVSFSAIDLGKNVTVSDGSYGITGIVFQVQLKESKKPLQMDSVILDGKYNVFEDYRKSKYYYSVGQSRSFDEIEKVYDEVKDFYDEAKIVAFENGESLSLRKAKKRSK
ncbi:MlaD family protein [Carboxylicivirga linearis]|uniref:MCE family protein n=1 Tax=Carboxylicivirga linearis TaxID=1628157 RepID=A0ABS5JWG8_9BACT|nr:MlaD family protein [Carboxylicivirga linearis]MBS2099255.1 MCE family protein [Carboxylicivirga linearis]